MRNRILVGLLLALIYGTFVFSVPHETVRAYGLETDLVMTYIPSAEKLKSEWGCEYDLYRASGDPFTLHGIGYAAILLAVGQLFDEPVRGWEYFEASKWVSLVSGMAIIMLGVIWLGILPGIISAVALGLNYRFFEICYSGCTDAIALALGLWGLYLAVKKHPLLGGILFGLVCCFRYEYLIFVWSTPQPT